MVWSQTGHAPENNTSLIVVIEGAMQQETKIIDHGAEGVRALGTQDWRVDRCWLE